jgi:hypothetical protein
MEKRGLKNLIRDENGKRKAIFSKGSDEDSEEQSGRLEEKRI